MKDTVSNVNCKTCYMQAFASEMLQGHIQQTIQQDNIDAATADILCLQHTLNEIE